MKYMNTALTPYLDNVPKQIHANLQNVGVVTVTSL